MTLRHVVAVTVLPAAVVAQVRLAGANCIYAVSQPASAFNRVVSIVQDDGSGSDEFDVAGFPSVVLPAPDGSETYVGVTTRGACPVESSVLAFSSDGAVREVSLATPGSLGNMAIHPDGTRLYAVDNLIGQLFVIATPTLQVTKTIPLMNAFGFCPASADFGEPGFVGMAISPDGQRLLVTTSYCIPDGCLETLSVIDTGTDSIVDELDASFSRLAFGPDSDRAYLAKGGVIGLSLFEVSSATLIDEFQVEVSDLATAPDGVFALAFSSLLVLDPQTNTVIREMLLRGRLIASDLTADRAYVATADRTEVLVLKASTGKILDQVPLENPSWIAAGPCPQNSGGGGDDGCNIEQTRPTWFAVATLLLGFGLFFGRSRPHL